MKTVALLGLVLSGAACTVSAPAGNPDSFPAEPLATIQSAAQGLTIEVRTGPIQPPERGDVSVEFLVTDQAGNGVDGLTIDPQLWMPDMGHGASVDPIVTPEGDGKYVIDRCELFMPGRWELRAAMTGAVEDNATATFQIP